MAKLIINENQEKQNFKKKLIENGKKYIKENFSEDKEKKEYIKLLNELLNISN